MDFLSMFNKVLGAVLIQIAILLLGHSLSDKSEYKKLLSVIFITMFIAGVLLMSYGFGYL